MSVPKSASRHTRSIAAAAMVLGLMISLVGIVWDSLHGLFAWRQLATPAMILAAIVVMRFDARK